jgi:hypothetical protein
MYVCHIVVTRNTEVITAARVVAPDDEAQSPKKKKKKSKKVVGLWVSPIHCEVLI